MSKVVNPAGMVATFANVLLPVEDMAELGGERNLHKQIKERARTEGFQQGYEAGYFEGQRQGHTDSMELHAAMLAEFADQLSSVDAAIPEAIQHWLDSTAEQIAMVAALVASEIIAQEVAIRPESILPMVSKALNEVANAQQARVRVNPLDAPMVADNVDMLLASTSTLRHLEIVRDPSIAAGCTIETDGGIIDARLDQMIDRAKEALRRAA